MSYPNQKTHEFLREHNFVLNESNGNRVLLWRHGQTCANEKGVICGSGVGSFRTPITEQGKNQAQAQINTLKSLLQQDASKAMVFSSPQPRAIETADIMTQWLGKPIETEMFLKEINCGVFEGKPYALNPPAPDEYVSNSPDGDTYRALCSGIFHGVRSLLSSVSGHTILMSTHGTTGSIINQVLGNKYQNLGNVDIFEYDRGLNLKNVHPCQSI